MDRWTCSECGRVFGSRKQGHDCAPALTEAEYFEVGPPHERAIYEVVASHIDTLDDVYTEFVSVGVFFKYERVFAQLRPMTKWSALSFSLLQPVSHPLIKKKVVPYSGRYHHTVNLPDPQSFDDRIAQWVTDAYLLDVG